MLKLKKSILSAALVLLSLLNGVVQAALTIEITQGVEGALPVAVVPFKWTGPTPRPPEDIGAIIAANLARSGRFEPLPAKDMLARPDSESDVHFANWRLIGSDYLVVGNLDYQGGDRYQIRFRIYDVFKGKQIDGYKMSSSGRHLRRAAHHASDIIYESLTGEPGAFNTEVAYVTAKGMGVDRRYTLWVADSDGHNAQALMNSNEPILSPAWSPDGKKLAYSSLENAGHQVVFVQEVLSGRRQLVAGHTGLNGAPAWSPDGKKLALSMSKDGNPEIYVLDLGSKKLRRLTRHWGIDTEPAWMPDGKSIIFTSDRGGRPQLYRVPSTGGRAKRLTFEGVYNSRPSVSPDGKKVAMIHRDNGKFRVAIMDLELGNLQVLTDGALDEAPSFAPNGSMILYATSSGQRGVLAAVSADGRVRQRLTVRKEEGDVREPAWSPSNKTK